MPSTIWSGKPRGPYPWNQRTNKQREEDYFLARFQTEAERAEAARERYFKSVFVREKFFRLTRRRKAYDDYHRKLHAKRLKDEYAIAIHEALRTSWRFMADTDELTYQYPVIKAAERISTKNREEWLETQKELDKWDLEHEPEEEEIEPLKEKGKRPKADKTKKAPPGPVPKPKDSKDGKGAKLHKNAPRNAEPDPNELPDPLLWGKQALAYVEEIKVRKLKESQDKFEALQRERIERSEMELAERLLKHEMEEKESQYLHWKREHGEEALRKKEEQRIAEEEEQKRVEYRMQMANALMQERQAEWDEVTSRDHELLSMMREDCLGEVYQEWLLWEAVRKRKEEDRKAKRLNLCTEIMLQIVTMMDIRIDYKAEFNSEISATNWRGWKTLFVQGVILPCPIFGIVITNEQPAANPNSIFAKAIVDEYLEEQGEWQGAHVIGKNKELGLILAEVHDVADSPPKPPELPNLTQFKLKIAVVGTPFAGKTTIVRKVENDFECVRIEMQNVVTSALALADVEEKLHKAKLAEEEKKREEAEAQRILEEKQKLEFDLQQEALGLKDIYLRSKNGTALRSPQLGNVESDLKADSKSGKGKELKSDPKTGMGKDVKASTKDEKGKADLKESKKSQKGGEKQKPDKAKKKEKETVSEDPPEPAVEPQPFGPPPEPPHPLAYLTPKARCGMEIKLAQAKGLQAPGEALAELVLLTLSNLQEYADAHPTEGEIPQKGDPKKGGKGEFAAKKKPKVASNKGVPTSQKGKSPSSSPRGKSSPKSQRDDQEVKVFGFILDGFPTNFGEAKALEWRLSGIDLDHIHNHQTKASRIAPPPKLTTKLRSALDGYFQLQGLDENECFKRAMGKVMDEKTGRIFHLDYDPPPTMKANPKEKGLVQRLVPVEDLEVVRPKITAGLEVWPRLSQYLENILNVFPIAQQEQDGKTMVDTVEPCSLAGKFLDGWSKTQAAKVAAQAGLEAQSVASQALVDAENANKLANEVAHKLWCAKLAEVETEQGLDALGGDMLAKKLVKDKVSVTVAKRLDEVCKAVKEAQEAAEAAGMASLQAEQRANLAKDIVDGADLEFAFHLRAEAEEAAEIAKQASLRADEAHKKAVMAFEAATAALLPKPEVTTEDRKEGGKKDKADTKNVKGAKEGKGAKVTKDPKDIKDVKGSKDAEGEKGVVDEKNQVFFLDQGSPVQLSVPPTLSPNESRQIPLIEKELAASLHIEWEGVEANYLKQLQTVFYTLHQERAITRNRVVEMMNQFISFLQARDERQPSFDEFQEKWNRIETTQRIDRKFKPKLMAEVVKLDKTLKDICARREKRCVELSEKSLVDLLESRTVSLIKIFTGIVQTELDRHLQSCNLLKEYNTKALGSELLSFRCALDEVASEPGDNFPLPGWIVTLAAPLPKLHKVFMKAMSVAYSILDVIAGKAPEKVDKKGKKGSEKKKEKLVKKEEAKTGRKGSKDNKDKIQAVAAVAIPIVETPSPPLDPSIPPATAREHEIFIHRLQRIAKVALSYFDELQPIVDGAFKRMSDWSTPRLKAESEVVQEVLSLCTEAAEEQIPLWYRVYLDGAIFHVDKSQLVLECPIKETTNLNLWFCKVLENFLNDFKAVSPQANYITAGMARASVTGAIMKTHTMFKNDLRESLLPRLPASKRHPYGPFQVWQDLADQMFEEILEDPNKEAKFVDWRGVLMALVDATFSHIISSASCEDMLSARKALFPVATLDKEGVLKGPETHGYILLEDFLGIKFWFDSSAPLSPGELDLGLALKIFLYNLLEEGSKGIHYHKLLLYICRDPIKKQALQKAFNVVAEAGTLSSEHHLTPETLLGILYPCGADAAWDQAIVPYILDDLYNLLYYVAKEKWDKAEREKESDLAGSEESGSNEDDKPCIQDRQITSSPTDSDRDTVEDFLVSAHNEFKELSEAETIKDFLCSLNIKRDASSHVHNTESAPCKCDVHVTVPVLQEAEVEEPDPYAIPETYTVQDILSTTATKSLSNMLFGNYGSKIVQLFDQVEIEDDNEEETLPKEEEKGKKKSSKDREKKDKKEKEKKEKKEKKGKKEKKE